jgi:hypothetical protein
MSSCPKCGGPATLLLTSWVCNNQKCMNYKPSGDDKTKKETGITSSDLLADVGFRSKIISCFKCKICAGRTCPAHPLNGHG